jgi:Fe-S-cluster containining protein
MERTCPGFCCLNFTLSVTKERLEFQRWHKQVFGNSSLAEIEETKIFYISETRIDSEDKPHEIWNCECFDKETMLCKIYPNRPKLCRNFPENTNKHCPRCFMNMENA